MKTLKIYQNQETTEFHIKGSSEVYGFHRVGDESAMRIANYIVDDRKQFYTYPRKLASFIEENTVPSGEVIFN